MSQNEPLCGYIYAFRGVRPMIGTAPNSSPASAPATASQRYRAFLSYSHKDSAWGNWIHGALESYRIPKELIGRATRLGPVPAKLRPIFRDRFDLAASHALGQTIDAALAASDNLIVLCSPASARSLYVNEEIRRFKLLGKTDRILALIVDGEPHDPARECFPDSLKYKIDADGKTTTEADLEPIAADARAHADGKDLAKLKLIAGLLGIGLDEIRKREAIAERRRRRIWMFLAGAMTGLAAVAFAGFWVAVLRTKDAERRFEIAFKAADGLVRRVNSMQDRFGVPEPVLEAMMTDAISQLDRLTQESGAASDLFRFRQAEAHLLAADLAKRRGGRAAEPARQGFRPAHPAHGRRSGQPPRLAPGDGQCINAPRRDAVGRKRTRPRARGLCERGQDHGGTGRPTDGDARAAQRSRRGVGRARPACGGRAQGSGGARPHA